MRTVIRGTGIQERMYDIDGVRQILMQVMQQSGRIDGVEVPNLTVKRKNISPYKFYQCKMQFLDLDQTTFANEAKACALMGSNIVNSTANGSDFSESQLQRSFISNTAAQNCNFTDCDMSQGQFHDVDFSGSNFTGANLSGSHFKNCNMNNVVLAATMNRGHFENCTFTGADLSGMNAVKTHFTEGSFAVSHLNWLHSCLVSTIFQYNECPYYKDLAHVWFCPEDCAGFADGSVLTPEFWTWAKLKIVELYVEGDPIHPTLKDNAFNG